MGPCCLGLWPGCRKHCAWGGHSRAELREPTGELCPLCYSCCSAQACLHGKGMLEQTVQGFQCLLPLKYTSLSRYSFSKWPQH